MRLRRGASLRWDDVFKWAKAHGAPNDRIKEIRIDGHRYPVLRMTGYSEDNNGQPYLANENEAAMWEASSILRFLP